MKRPFAALVGMTLASGIALCQPPPAPPPAVPQAQVRAIAGQIQAGQIANAQQAAAGLAKAGPAALPGLMTQFRGPKKGGLAVGGSPSSIEQTLRTIARDAPTDAVMKKQGPGFVQMGNDVTAVGLVLQAMAPGIAPQKRGQWIQHTTDLTVASKKLARAAGDGDAAAVQAAAMNVDNACNACHRVMR